MFHAAYNQQVTLQISIKEKKRNRHHAKTGQNGRFEKEIGRKIKLFAGARKNSYFFVPHPTECSSNNTFRVIEYQLFKIKRAAYLQPWYELLRIF